MSLKNESAHTWSVKYVTQTLYCRKLVGFIRLSQCHQLLAGGVGFYERLIAGFSRTFHRVFRP